MGKHRNGRRSGGSRSTRASRQFVSMSNKATRNAIAENAKIINIENKVNKAEKELNEMQTTGAMNLLKEHNIDKRLNFYDLIRKSLTERLETENITEEHKNSILNKIKEHDDSLSLDFMDNEIIEKTDEEIDEIYNRVISYIDNFNNTVEDTNKKFENFPKTFLEKFREKFDDENIIHCNSYLFKLFTKILETDFNHDYLVTSTIFNTVYITYHYEMDPEFEELFFNNIITK